MPDDLKTDVIIVGGGLAGLSLAQRLHRAGLGFHLFEARPRFGGRITTLDAPGGRVDLGPSWFWPGQPRMAELTADLGLRVFAQHAAGEILFEDGSGTVHRGAGFASMEGSFRVDGGMTGLVEGLLKRLPETCLHLSRPVDRVGPGWAGLADGATCRARHLALAVPPRIAAGLSFDPPLPAGAKASLAGIPTWMAGHAKFVAVYDRPFWRDAGLSGDAMSRHGPLAEIHDASGAEGTPAALFGFVGIAAVHRCGASAEIEALALRQLVRLFGPEAARPVRTALKDWALEPLTATSADQAPPAGHPPYEMPPALIGLGDGRLHVCTTETAPEMGGLMEGALASAERVARLILADMRPAAAAP